MRRVKVITSHTGLARFMAELSEEPVGEVPSSMLPDARYSFSPVRQVWARGNAFVAIIETSHRRYEVFHVPADVVQQPQLP